MTDPSQDQVEDTIAKLLRTPVGRRWLLKAGFTAAAAAAVPRWAEAGAPLRPLDQRRQLHFTLGKAVGVTNLQVVANGQRIALSRHTRATQKALRAQGGVWQTLRVEQLTHFANVPLPRDRGLVVSVYGTRGDKTVVVAQTFHVPEQATRALAQLAFRLHGHFGAVIGSPRRLASLGLTAAHVTTVADAVSLDRIVDSESTAANLVMCHPNVSTIDANAGVATKSLLGQTAEVGALGSCIDQLHQDGKDWATLDPVVDASGQPSRIRVDPNSTNTIPLHTFKLNPSEASLHDATRSAVVAGVRGVRDNGGLGTVLDKPLDESPPDTATWHQSTGLVVKPMPYTPPSGLGAGVSAQVENPGLLHGTYTYLNGPVSGRSVPLKLYNNYVRWVWVYVQYLDAAGNNLSASASPTWPNTRYAQSLGLLPQVFTVLGVPLWDTNTITANLNFPAGATSARILFGGLGNQGVDGGWRQWFPADAYPDHIAPQDEVLFASITTGILTIGMSAFALLTDLDIASVWAEARDIPAKRSLEAALEYEKLVAGGSTLAPAEAAATQLAGGAATFADLAGNGGDPSNIWNTLLSLGSVIPKLLFGPQAGPIWGQLAFAIVSASIPSKIAEATPLVGEIIAAIVAAGDLATLLESIGETIASPWIIKNQVNLSYQAAVTVSKDPRAATWPVTGRSWQLQATIDGTVVPGVAASGSLNDGGHIQSDPLTLSLTVPYGGNSIRWTLVVKDAAGHQVGSGVVQYANNVPDAPPATVAFAITEIPVPITSSTRFLRADTTTYSTTAGGYTWSNTVPDTGTLADTGIQEVTGVTIATRLGVAGIVWKQNDKYYLRGVPIAENGNTIALGGATGEGYSRRPFLLFDAFVDDTDRANHVLLEPDDVEPGYHIRALTIDPTNGTLSWNAATSLGYFALPVSAAALHCSGRVVALHTDSGRLGQVQPASTPRAPLAAYSAGPGTEIGLLSSPTAVAVTHAGVVLVLEAGASQLAAFDLNGNPVRYFGSATPAAFTLPLPTTSVYLDIAIDGAANIYLLRYAGAGNPQPDDYSIDVYTPTGEPLVTGSFGTNVPHLAVDYWRSIYAANYTPLCDSGTNNPHIGAGLSVAEPSLSRFDPS